MVFMLSTHERGEDYAAMEVAMTEKLKLLAPRHTDHGHLALMTPFCCADGAAALIKGERDANAQLRREHDEEKLLTCYTHMWRGGRLLGQKHLVGKKTEMSHEIKTDLMAMHLLPYGFSVWLL